MAMPMFVSSGGGSNAAAHEAARQACAIAVRGYEHDGATVTEMREYAGCINRLHGSAWSDGELLAAKAAILFIFAAVVVGMVYEWQRRVFALDEGGALTRGIGLFMAMFFSAMGGAVLVACVYGIWYGIAFLLA